MRDMDGDSLGFGFSNKNLPRISLFLLKSLYGIIFDTLRSRFFKLGSGKGIKLYESGLFDNFS